jgi:hypothetical protein
MLSEDDILMRPNGASGVLLPERHLRVRVMTMLTRGYVVRSVAHSIFVMASLDQPINRLVVTRNPTGHPRRAWGKHLTSGLLAELHSTIALYDVSVDPTSCVTR